MQAKCPVAQFISHRIQVLGKPQIDISREAGFDKPNIITMIKQGNTKLPLAKVGHMANALETDPVALLKLCIRTYYPETWQAIETLFDSALSEDELTMVRALRSIADVPNLNALTDESKKCLNDFLLSVRVPTSSCNNSSDEAHHAPV